MPTEQELRGPRNIFVPVPYVPAAGVAGGIWVAPYKLTLTAAKLVWGAAVTGQATNFFTISFFNRGAAGAGTVQFATAIAYSSGGVADTKATPRTLTLSSTASDLQVATGDVISVEITTTGTGLIAPGGAVYLTANSR